MSVELLVIGFFILVPLIYFAIANNILGSLSFVKKNKELILKILNPILFISGFIWLIILCIKYLVNMEEENTIVIFLNSDLINSIDLLSRIIFFPISLLIACIDGKMQEFLIHARNARKSRSLFCLIVIFL